MIHYDRVAVAVALLLAGLAVNGAIIWVAIHFITKYW